MGNQLEISAEDMKQKVIIIILSLAALIVAGAGYVAMSIRLPVVHEDATFYVQRGTPLIMIAEQLKRAGVIKSALAFNFYARISGADRKIKAGEYLFPNGLSAKSVLHKMVEGDYKLYKITLIEGWTYKQMAAYLAMQPFVAPGFYDRFVAACEDTFFLQSLGLDSDTVEGYLFPDTYMIERPRSADWLVGYLIGQFRRVYTPEFDWRGQELGLTMGQVVTLASIIEKETGAEAERPFISSVFHNRLKKHMLLQTDPTVIYGIKDFDGNLRKIDLSNQHPYNTYVHAGLPPGPIANPGLASIKTALWPAVSDFLYFVSRGDGTHEFTKTLADHSKAVAKFQLNAR